jgi:hypothetical protein
MARSYREIENGQRSRVFDGEQGVASFSGQTMLIFNFAIASVKLANEREKWCADNFRPCQS